MTFKVVQCLCPDRHVIAAMIFEEDIAIDRALGYVDDAIAGATKGDPDMLRVLGLSSPLDPECATCGAKRESWTLELGALKVPDLQSAIEELAGSVN